MHFRCRGFGFGASEDVGGATFLVLYKGCYGVYPLAAYSGPYPESPNDTTTWEAEGAGFNYELKEPL